MSRFAPAQPDLFAPAAAPAAPRPPPMAELSALLETLRQATRLPWPDAAATMAEERRVLGLARRAGPDGDRLARAILEETERLFTVADAGG